MVRSSSFSVGLCLLSLAGCQSMMMPDDRLQVSIAHRLGVPVEDVTLSNRSDEATMTYVNARVRGGGTYSCSEDGGGWQTLGMMDAPDCRPVAAHS